MSYTVNVYPHADPDAQPIAEIRADNLYRAELAGSGLIAAYAQFVGPEVKAEIFAANGILMEEKAHRDNRARVAAIRAAGRNRLHITVTAPAGQGSRDVITVAVEWPPDRNHALPVLLGVAVGEGWHGTCYVPPLTGGG